MASMIAGGAALLAVGRVGEVVVEVGVDVGHRPAANDVRNTIRQQLSTHDEDPWGARPTDELVWAEEHGILARQRPSSCVVCR